MKHLNIWVYGKVQGVFFRQTAKQEAESLGISGFARNEPDGTVHIEAEGDEDTLKQFKNWCEYGSEIAEVEKVEVEEGEVAGYSGFSTR